MSEQHNSTTTLEERQKQVATWVAGIFIGLSLAFLIYSIYIVIVDQQGRFDLSDKVLMPLTVVMLGVSLVSFWLIRNGRLALGTGLLFVILVLVPPIIAVLVLQDFGMTSVSYIVLMASIMIVFVLPRSSRRPAVIATVVAILITILIEVLDPSFRTRTAIGGVANTITILAVLSLLVLFVRRAWSGNIRTKLLASFIGIAVFSVGIIVFSAQRSFRTSLTEEIANKLADQANSRSVEIATSIDRDADLLKTLSMNVSIQNAARAANETFQLSQADIDQLDQQWRAADAANNDADLLVSGVINNKISTQLRDFRSEFAQHAEVFLTGTQGFSIASTNRTSDYNQADEEWWQTAYRGSLYIGPPEYDASSKTLAMNMAVPVRENGNGRIIGVLRTTVNFTNVASTLEAGTFGQTGRTIILLPSGEEIRLNAVGDGSFELILEEALPELLALTQSAFGFQNISLNGTPTLVNIASVIPVGEPANDTRAVSNLAWQAVTLQDEAEALQPVTTQSRNALIVGIIIILIAIMAAIGLASVISEPIIRLNTVAQKIAAGDITVQAKVETRDEIGTLATTFNSMTARLRDFINTLEARVSERTRNLELAAEVGRTVSQVRALDIMLTDAAELIRKQFDLYYVQVYLTDPSQTNLILQSGTGAVGAELVRRGHRLPLNTASINGRAALEKHSVVISNTTESSSFKPNPLLPNTSSEMAVPLMIGERVVGVLDMQSETPGSLNQDVLSAFEALAGQLAIAIQNANFLAETEQARAEVESQAQRLTRANWADYLDAIHKPEETGFVFEQNKITPLTQTREASDNALTAPIAVTGETLGNLIVEMEGGSPIALTEELVNAVAQQVARQIESLRLLDSAERYRAEAEQASRRLTHEGWQAYAANTNNSLSYVYDLKEVRTPSDNEDRQVEESGYTLPLKVRDETVGKLVVQGLDAGDGESTALVDAVAERLGAHIESLRLTRQTEQALATTQKQAQREQALRQITSAVRGSTDPTTILRSAARELGTLLGRKTIVRLNTEQPKAIAYNGNEPVTPAESQNADGGNK